MSFLFGGGGDGGAAQKQIAMQEKQTAKQEKELAAKETQAAMQRQSKTIARGRGALRPLLSAARADAETGITDTSKLGGGSSYMA